MYSHEIFLEREDSSSGHEAKEKCLERKWNRTHIDESVEKLYGCEMGAV